MASTHPALASGQSSNRIGRPTRTVSGTGRGHRRPGGSASPAPARWHGSTGTDPPHASIPSPGRNAPSDPSRLRVPSGNREHVPARRQPLPQIGQRVPPPPPPAPQRQRVEQRRYGTAVFGQHILVSDRIVIKYAAA